MPTLEMITYRPHRADIENGCIRWNEAKGRKLIQGLPQIFWMDHTPWREANLWALEQSSSHKKSLKTILSAMTHLHAYAKWLEAENLNWWHFPAREADRCLVRFRGNLISARDNGEIAPSTAKHRMSAVIRFYRWLCATRLLSPEWPMWVEQMVGVRLTDGFGFQRTMMVNTTDLSITNRRAEGFGLEDGLLPVAIGDVLKILNFAIEHASTELYLMLKLGFSTGMRIGTICDLKLQTLDRAVADPEFPGFNKLAVGPGARPPVSTKFGVTGQVWISDDDLEALRHYMLSPRRLKRQAQAKQEHRHHLFLTRFGSRFNPADPTSSKAVNVELGRLRKLGISKGIIAFKDFRFHRSRCTFATELARAAMKTGDVGLAIHLVKQALLHKEEATTIKYIKFIEKTKAMGDAADAFTRDFLGLASMQVTSNA